MKAQLKRLHSPDIDLSSFWPEDTKHFSFLIEAYIGPEDESGADSFGIQVCTPQWLESNYSRDGAIFGRHTLVVFDYDLDVIKKAISRYCDRCVGNDWQHVALQVARIGRWEFEDYQP